MLRFLFKLIFFFLLVGAILVYWFFFNVYSEGERKGTLVKITKKGDVFKTYEGEMWLSCRNILNAEKFYFSVADENLSDSMKIMEDECITVSYKQYRRTLSWRGDSKYVVKGFSRLNTP